MIFIAPLWLLGLLPWLAVTVWLLRKRRRPTGVPFIEFWQRGPVTPPKPARNFASPPWPLALAMLAMLLALLAAARPAVRGRGGRPLTILVDRGATMSAGAPRFLAVSRDVATELGRRGSRRPVELVLMPGAGPARTDAAGWLDVVERAKRTAVPTGDLLWPTVARRLAESNDPVLVVTDHPPALSDERLIVVAPPAPSDRHVGIAHVAARELPTPQVMVSVEATSWEEPVVVGVSTGGRATGGRLEASPGTTGRRDLFIDVPVLGPVVDLRLDSPGGGDAAAADDRAWLVREGTWPRVEPGAALPASLDRFIRTYAAARPPTDESPRVRVTDQFGDVRNDQPAVFLETPADGDRAAVEPVPAGEVEVVSHPVTRNVTFPPSFGSTGQAAPPAGWTPIVKRGDDVVVAVREAPTRQVWVGIGEFDTWSRTPGFVIFWANVFDWLGAGGATYTYHAPGTVGAGVDAGTRRSWCRRRAGAVAGPVPPLGRNAPGRERRIRTVATAAAGCQRVAGAARCVTERSAPGSEPLPAPGRGRLPGARGGPVGRCYLDRIFG